MVCVFGPAFLHFSLRMSRLLHTRLEKDEVESRIGGVLQEPGPVRSECEGLKSRGRYVEA